MAGGEDTHMVDLADSKLDVVLKAIEALSMRTNRIEDFVTKLNTDQGSIGSSQPSSHTSTHMENSVA